MLAVVQGVKDLVDAAAAAAPAAALLEHYVSCAEVGECCGRGTPCTPTALVPSLLLHQAELPFRLPALAFLQPWCRRAFVVVSWALCWPGRLLDLFGQPIYTLFTAITVTWAWLSFVYCMLLAVLLDGSLSERLTWVVAGVGAAYGAAGVLVTYDVPARRERTAALQQRHKDALQMCKEWQSSECRGLQFYSGLAACAAEKLHLELVGPKA